jgi:protein-S-isoprenylcysteine O-methyltransferase Ste14
MLAPKIRFWPPPGVDTWQYRVFWTLFRILVLGIVLLSVLDYHGSGAVGGLRFSIGVLFVLVGFGAAFYATFYLGWRNAHGQAEGLKTDGWYHWSRNPVYVVSIVGIIGIGLLVNSSHVTCLLSLWALTYLVAPFLEEPWLENEYGKAFLDYKEKVPRFIGIPFFRKD